MNGLWNRYEKEVGGKWHSHINVQLLSVAQEKKL
jgi:hypothetical protein